MKPNPARRAASAFIQTESQTANQAEWKLKWSHEILGLKIADIACGSGAFLVAAARYLAERVVEAWTIEDPANAARVLREWRV